MGAGDTHPPVVGYWHPPVGGGAYGADRGGDKRHPGIDVGGPVGRPVYAVADLAIRRVVDDPNDNAGFRGYGRSVVAEVVDQPGTFVLYAHLDTAEVDAGETVSAGTRIGTMGRTAWRTHGGAEEFRTSRAHLHLEFSVGHEWPKRYGKGAIDPLAWFADRGLIGASFADRGATFREADGWGVPMGPGVHPTPAPPPPGPKDGGRGG